MRRLIIGLLALLAVAAGAFIGLADFDIPLETLKEKYATEPSQFVTLPSGMEVHYRDQGNPNGRVLVLLHGSNASLFTWEPWVKEFSEDYRIITLDLPGHGMTSLEPTMDYSTQRHIVFLESFFTALDLETFILGGNSMGGRMSWRYTLEHPERVETLLLLNASGVDLGRSEEPSLVERIAQTPYLNKLLLFILPKSLVADGLREAIEDDDLVTQAMVDQYHAFLLREGRRAHTLHRLRSGWEENPEDRLSEITAPTLIIWGELDALVPVEAAYVFEEKIPGSKLIVYPEIGHLPMEEIPGESADGVKAFLSLH